MAIQPIHLPIHSTAVYENMRGNQSFIGSLLAGQEEGEWADCFLGWGEGMGQSRGRGGERWKEGDRESGRDGEDEGKTLSREAEDIGNRGRERRGREGEG